MILTVANNSYNFLNPPQRNPYGLFSVSAISFATSSVTTLNSPSLSHLSSPAHLSNSNGLHKRHPPSQLSNQQSVPPSRTSISTSLIPYTYTLTLPILASEPSSFKSSPTNFVQFISYPNHFLLLNLGGWYKSSNRTPLFIRLLS